MAAFAPAFNLTQSDDGTIITISDTSNWVGNTEGYNINDFARQVVLKDAYDVIIATVPFTGADLTETYALNVDKWVRAYYTAVGSVSFAPAVQQYAFYRLAQNKYRKAISSGCGCGNSQIDLCSVDAFFTTAMLAIPVGNGPDFQVDIDAANSYLNA